MFRYFYEEYPELSVLAAGSLLEFTLADHSFSTPVGRVEYFHLYQLTFREFLAVTKSALLPYLDTLSPSSDQIPHAAHQQLLGKLKDYFFVGGLPEAVQVFSDGESLQEVAAVHRLYDIKPYFEYLRKRHCSVR